jgi:IS5 family transposase
MSLSPAERTERARIAAHTRWAKEPDRLAATAPGRRAMFEHFERQVDPEGVLAPDVRAKLAENARKAQLADARRRSLKLARERKERKEVDAAAMASARQDSRALKEKPLQDTLAMILQTMPLSDEARERITELIRQGDADGP